MSYISDTDKLIEDLLELRKKVNSKVDEEWKAEPFAYYHPRDATPDNPGGWTDGDDSDWFVYSDAGNITGSGQYKGDAIYIAALHNALPLLIEEIKRLNWLPDGNR